MLAVLVDENVAEPQAILLPLACMFAAIALLLCETCHTAHLEFAYIWARGRARIILLFTAIRHLQLASLIMSSIPFVFVSPTICTTFSLAGAIITVIPYFAWAVFLAWRAYALSSGNALVASLVFVGSASFPVPSVMQIAVVVASRCANIFAEAVVLALTCRASYGAWISSRNNECPISLPHILYQNGMMCFLVGTVLHVTTAILTILPQTHDNLLVTVTVFRDTIITILLSRFLIQLAIVGARVNDDNQGVHFTKGVLTTEWSPYLPDVSSQRSLEDEYNGRGFDRDIEAFSLRGQREA